MYKRLWKLGAYLGCHRIPERSFFIKGKQFPLCARCTGAVIGYLIGGILYFFVKLDIWICILFGLIMFADWLIQYLKWKKSTNFRRLITGILCGVGIIQIYFMIIEYIIKTLYSYNY